MIKKILILVVVVATGMGTGVIAGNKALVKEYRLGNGMRVWLSEEHSQPRISGAVVVRAGAKDCPDTGIAHYFEHMLFKGTARIGTIDFQAERPYLDSISDMYDSLSLALSGSETDSIQKAINRLSIAESEYVIPNEFDHLISRFGGSGLNAYTSFDNTVFYNDFLPEYLSQWAELNSERLIDPVFRLFQSELETVYEEKNMYADNAYSASLDKLIERIYEGTPYQYPIIGSTENLKKPNQKDMARFYSKYYVGNNMGLMLCGDFMADSVIPILERTFGRISPGTQESGDKVEIRDFEGRERFSVKVPVPVVSAFGRIYRGPSAGSPDVDKIEILCALLNNSNGTGYLDRLTNDNKLLMAGCMYLGEVNDGGVIVLAGIPKLITGSRSSAEKMVVREIDRLKTGDISDSVFTAIKLEKRRQILRQLENSDMRMAVMIDVFGKGNSWSDYVSAIENLEALTMDDIVECANRYFGDNYLYVRKKYGSYPKDRLQKPDIEAIPQNAALTAMHSAYYDSLDRADTVKPCIKLIDFEKDAPSVSLGGRCRLYHKPFSVNDVFELNIRYEAGRDVNKMAGYACDYLDLLGTDSLSYMAFRNRLQELGSTLSFSSDNNFFNVNVIGFDENFKPTMELVEHFFTSVEGDKKKTGQIKSTMKLEEKSFMKSPDNIAAALSQRVRVGDKSEYLDRVTSRDIGKLGKEDLIGVFNQMREYECTVHYSGGLPRDAVAEAVVAIVRPEIITKEGMAYQHSEYLSYEKPVVYFYDMPKTRQSIITGNIFTSSDVTDEERAGMQLLNFYFGGDMTSVMFQQIREFRSMAYGAYSRLRMNAPKWGPGRAVIAATISTQSDKTMGALMLLDSLIHNMPLNEVSLESAKRSLGNYANNLYPDQRSLTMEVTDNLAAGYKSSSLCTMKSAMDIGMEEFREMYADKMKGANTVYVMVGSKKDIDMEKLRQFADVIFVKSDFFYKKR